MPGWHEKTRELQEQGKVKMVGIIQEQHPYRTRLFMQWKNMYWPILVDPLNLLDVEAVPITLLIDERGIIRAIRPTEEDFQSFLATESDAAAARSTSATSKEVLDLDKLAQAARENDSDARRAYADALVLWGQSDQISQAIRRACM